VTIEIKNFDDSTNLDELVSRLEFNPFRLIPEESPESRNAAWLCSLQKISQSNGSMVYCATEDSTLAGICAFSPMPWDSQLFKKKMGQIHYLSATTNAANSKLIIENFITKILKVAKEQQYSFILHKCPSENFRNQGLLEEYGFRLKSTILNFAYDYRKQDPSKIQITPPPSDIKIRLAKPNDEEATVHVSHLAYENFFGRYHADENISREQATHVYEEWIHSSYKGYADLILVAEHEKRIVGFSIWKKSSQEEKKLSNRLAHLSLGAVDPGFASKGIYNSLLLEGLKALELDNDIVMIPTQICNYPAQRAYIRLGWRPNDSFHDFHLWLPS
jgi:ribosomal protein S18 acetylase RimI-like enzyme